MQSQHFIAVEISTGMVFCGMCNVFIWNGPLGLAACGEFPGALQESDGSLSAHCVSMRGLVNMGSTCFMSSALQVLLHCDPLIGYFLSSGHALKKCSKRSKAGAGSVCLACEFDTLFNQNYAGQSSPYAPHQLLHAIWRSSKHLAGYEQQDAHEFLISTLNQLHTDLGGSHFACKCPVHLTFTGVLQSDVTCSSCGTVNASFDPFLDISLDILTSHGSDFVVDPNGSSLTLSECFQLFTFAEKLSPNTYMCSACNHTYQEATKQLSIRKAPEILTIHLKRFEHSFNTVKIDTFLQFPLEFSIFDYTTEGVHLNNELTRISAMSGGLSPTIIDPLYNQKKYGASLLYRLIGIINHLGNVDSGHYVSYAVHPNDPAVWFKFDDATVSKVPVSVVLNSNPYMLFYQRVGESEGTGDISLIE
jgi:ubiquitin carboxyl-terminal hydrolase 22/27/51